MTKRSLRGILVGVCGLALLVGGIATASNMGFKFVPSVAAGKAFNLSMPWNNNFNKANLLFNDLVGQDPDVARISKFTSTATFIDWVAGAPTANNFDVVKGEAYIIWASASRGAIDQAVVVGSHDPNYTFSFTAGSAFNAAAPYHQTFTKANQLFNDMNTKLGAGSIGRISAFTPSATFIDWVAGAPTANNFDLTLGMGVIIWPSQTVSGYVWPHY